MQQGPSRLSPTSADAAGCGRLRSMPDAGAEAAPIGRIDLGSFSDLLASPFADELSAATGTPSVVIDLDRKTTRALPPVGEAISSVPCVSIGVARRPVATGARRLANLLDVVIVEPDVASPGLARPVQPADGADAALSRVLGVISAAPMAATALALLLRSGPPSVVGPGLVAESATYSMLQAGPEFARWRLGRAPRSAPEQGEPAVRMARAGDTLFITLSRPERHNAFNVEMRDGLIEALRVALADPTLRVHLGGDGPSFCSGGDLDEFGTRPDPASAHVTRLTHSAARMLHELRDRTTVHLHGACMGAGIELAAFGAHVVAEAGTTCALPEVGLGLVPGAGGTVSIPRRIGRMRTTYLALCGAPIDAATALGWGLIDELKG